MDGCSYDVLVVLELTNTYLHVQRKHLSSYTKIRRTDVDGAGGAITG